ncbi:hypothetical protein C8R44DRAFT_342369 [Mycena epipterygia]|nr:hypothetical protein C8R44DRAFT_342369 [Mycena epipterygia]
MLNYSQSHEVEREKRPRRWLCLAKPSDDRKPALVGPVFADCLSSDRHLAMEDKPKSNRSDPIPYALSPLTKRLVRSNEAPLGLQEKELLESIVAAQTLKSSLAQQITDARKHLLLLQRADENATRKRLIPSNEALFGFREKELDANAQTLQSSLTQQITDSQLHLLRLERADENATLHIEGCTSALGPIRRLPPEVLSRIFAFYHATALPACKYRLLNINEEPDMSMFAAWNIWRLGHICSYWRDVALGTRELWSTFRFQCPGSTASTVQAAQTWLQRSGSHALSLSFCCRTIVGHTEGHADSFPPIGHACREVFEMLLSQRKRWKDAQFLFPQSFLPALASLRNNIPLLQQFLANILDYSNVEQLPNVFAVAPALRVLYLSNILIPDTTTIPWNQITACRSEQYYHGGTHILNLAPNILMFTLDARDSASDYSTGIIEHQLRHLHFISGTNTLRSLVLPALESFQFSPGAPFLAFNPAPFDSVVSLFEYSGKKLTRLHIDDFNPALPGVLDVLAATPLLTSLTVVGGSMLAEYTPDEPVVSHLFDRLTYRQEQTLPALVPMLRELSTNELPPSDAIVRMVASRSRASPETVRLESFVFNAMHVSEVEHESSSYVDRFRQLEAHGLSVSVDMVIVYAPPKNYGMNDGQGDDFDLGDEYDSDGAFFSYT